MNVATTPEIDAFLASGSPVAIGCSGGKDSCAVAFATCEHLDRIGHTGKRILIHSDLGMVEWKDSAPTCARLADRLGVELVTVSRKAGGMMERWESRWRNNVARYANLECVKLILPWSTASMRFCTAELKRDVICADLVRRFPNSHILSVSGIRRDESPRRAKSSILKPQPKMTSKKWGTLGFDWNALLEWKLADVFTYLEQKDFSLHEAYKVWGSSRVSCAYCLAGETEIVTRQGVKEIAPVAGQTVNLLIPKKGPQGGLATHGHFSPTKIRSYGKQKLWKISLHRGKQKKVIYTTKEHRWFVVGKSPKKRSISGALKGYNSQTLTKTTGELCAGDSLVPLIAHPPMKTGEVPFAVAQGFVYGDGAKGFGERPATLPIYSRAKELAMLPYFAKHQFKNITANGKPAVHAYGLPRLWKSAPDLAESRSFLLSWLAGYFAADGQVTSCGSARIDSASYTSMTVVRDVAAVCGIGFGPIRYVKRLGYGKKPSKLYSLTIDTRFLPNWFFLIAAHRARIEDRRSTKETWQRCWVVDSVRATKRIEEVFCAEVPDVHAFGLANDLMTGNCILGSQADLAASTTCPDNHDVYRRMVDLEIESTFAFKEDKWLGDVAPHLLSEENRELLKKAKSAAKVREEAEARIPEHLLYTKGWPTCVPTQEEAVLLAEVRKSVAEAVGIEIGFTTPESIIQRYLQLMAEKE